MEKIAENKEMFISIVKENIKRQGIESLLSYLEKTDFFVAPCSTKYHLNVAGGLCQHSLNVYSCLIKLCNEFGVNVVDNIETLTLISLFHDLCKADFYKMELKPVKENNRWIEKKVYVIDDTLPLGHGEKSVMLLLQHILLTKEEMLAIRWHMGPYDEAVKGGSYSMSTAQSMSELVTLLHVADLLASQIVEKS